MKCDICGKDEKFPQFIPTNVMLSNEQASEKAVFNLGRVLLSTVIAGQGANNGS